MNARENEKKKKQNLHLILVLVPEEKSKLIAEKVEGGGIKLCKM